MTWGAVFSNPLTVYRKCSCGETAHDYTGQRDPQGWPFYACRNCRRLVTPRGRRERMLQTHQRIRDLHKEAAIFRRAQDDEAAEALEAEARELERGLR
jgi:hypothetical protein